MAYVTTNMQKCSAMVQGVLLQLERCVHSKKVVQQKRGMEGTGCAESICSDAGALMLVLVERVRLVEDVQLVERALRLVLLEHGCSDAGGCEHVQPVEPAFMLACLWSMRAAGSACVQALV